MKSIVHASARQGLRATSDSLTTRDGREVSVEARRTFRVPAAR